MKFKDFNLLYEYINKTSYEELIREALLLSAKKFGFECNDNDDIEKLRRVLNSNEAQQYVYKTGDRIEEYIKDLKNNIDKYKRLYYEVLKDEDSKKVIFNILAYRFTNSDVYLSDAYSLGITQYFDSTVAIYTENCVYADCGGLDGETTAEFIAHCPEYKKVYLFEPMKCYYQDCIENVKPFNDGRIEVISSAVYNENRTLVFDLGENPGSSTIDDSGSIEVNAVKMDDIIEGPIGFIKMDIEGSEKPALLGCRRHIQEDIPMLAICIYHKTSDLWEIQETIDEMSKEYNYYIRHHDLGSTNETVLYAVPKKHIDKLSTKGDTINVNETFKGWKLLNTQNKREKILALEAKSFLLKQVENHQVDFKKLEEDYKEREQWIKKLEEDYKEREEWINELEKGKEWIEQQYKSEKEQLNKVNEYLSELEQGKEWLDKQYHKLKVDVEQQIKIESEKDEEISILKNQLSKIEYKFNKIKSDSLIRKIIKYKKYDI